MKTTSTAYWIVGLILLTGLFAHGSYAGDRGPPPSQRPSIGMAVEFMTHAAPAYVARDKGWFETEGLQISAYDSYVTGMALAAALARKDIKVAYMCLVPAINVFANAGLPLRVVAGTHKYGYGFVADPAKITDIQDLEKPGIRIGCVREGGSVDVLMRKLIEHNGLNKKAIINNIRRMSPQKQVFGLKMKRLDAAFLPEHWATMAEAFGSKMLIATQDLWPGFQGSVLVVTEDLIENHPGLLYKLLRVNKKATDWVNHNKKEAARIVARHLSSQKSAILIPGSSKPELKVTPQIVFQSLNRMLFTTDLNVNGIQKQITYMAKLEYIKPGIHAQSLVWRGLPHER